MGVGRLWCAVWLPCHAPGDGIKPALSESAGSAPLPGTSDGNGTCSHAFQCTGLSGWIEGAFVVVCCRALPCLPVPPRGGWPHSRDREGENKRPTHDPFDERLVFLPLDTRMTKLVPRQGSSVPTSNGRRCQVPSPHLWSPGQRAWWGTGGVRFLSVF